MAEPDESLRSPGEVALEPALPICDPHHHLWERAGVRYFPADFLRDTGSGHNIVSTVAVECGAFYRRGDRDELKPVGETEFLESVATRGISDSRGATSVAAGIVGHADLTLGDAVAAVLDAHLQCSPSRFRGIRFSTTWDASGALRNDAPSGLLSDSRFRRGLACLQRYGLSFDAWLYHPQLAELADLARALPEVTIVLDHIGGPVGVGPYAGIRNEVFQTWREGIAAVASCHNVAVKLGGFGSERSGFHWHERAAPPGSAELAQAMLDYIEFCIERFGVHRCMFESNFPVEKRANSYVAVWNAFKLVTRGYSAAERQALFHDTAARVYRLELTAV